ncbi:MAG: DUF1684 domain-containing protein [Chthoniobacterales bacterium]
MKTAASVVLALLLSALVPALAESDYVAGIQKWRAEEEADLKKPDGWLALAGLFWLKEGTNTVGAGSSFDVRLTDNFKEGKFGEIAFHNGSATLMVDKGVDATAKGEPVATIELASDANGKPTEIHIGSQLFYLIQRGDRYGIRVKDSESKSRTEFKGQNWYPIDQSYRVKAHLQALPKPKELLVPNVLGGHFKMKSPGLLHFKLAGKELSFQPVLEDDGSLFIIFRDATNDTETYSAGRFLHADKPVNGEAILDFNKAENPPCAFTPYATCPLPPAGNDLPVAIKAGEKRYDH